MTMTMAVMMMITMTTMMTMTMMTMTVMMISNQWLAASSPVGSTAAAAVDGCTKDKTG